MRRITSFGRSSSWELQVAGLWDGRGEHIRDMRISGQSSGYSDEVVIQIMRLSRAGCPDGEAIQSRLSRW